MGRSGKSRKREAECGRCSFIEHELLTGVVFTPDGPEFRRDIDWRRILRIARRAWPELDFSEARDSLHDFCDATLELACFREARRTGAPVVLRVRRDDALSSGWSPQLKGAYRVRLAMPDGSVSTRISFPHGGKLVTFSMRYGIEGRAEILPQSWLPGPWPGSVQACRTALLPLAL